MSATETALIHVTSGQIVVGEEYQIAHQALSERAAKIVAVTDKDSCSEALECCAMAERNIKAIIAAAEPERLRLQGLLADLRAQRDKFVAAFQTLVAAPEKMAREYSLKERQDAKAEQDKINRGKKPEQRVEVKPELPKVPGKRILVHYRSEVFNADALLNAYVVARGPRKVFLRQFIIVDEQAVAKEFRENIKDPKQAASVIPGCKFWQE